MSEDGTWADESDWESTEFVDSVDDVAAGSPPVVAVVGRPNVGKSSLVNRILGRREAVVQDVPGVTRDRVSYDALWTGRRFVVQDTGGWEPDAEGLQMLVAEQASVAMRTADAVILVVDAVVGATAGDEAAARILRRSGKGTEEPRSARLTFADIELDEDTHEVWKAGEPVSLSPTEFTLLRYFIINAGTVLSKPKILDHVWRYDFGGDVNVVESYVSYLRRKIDTGEKRLLHTLRGVGYVLREPR